MDDATYLVEYMSQDAIITYCMNRGAALISMKNRMRWGRVRRLKLSYPTT